MNLITDVKGTERWYNDKGQLHRLDGPAVVFPFGTKMWLKNGKLHRLDGPAIIYGTGQKPLSITCTSEEWYINGVRYTEDEFEDILDQYFS